MPNHVADYADVREINNQIAALFADALFIKLRDEKIIEKGAHDQDYLAALKNLIVYLAVKYSLSLQHVLWYNPNPVPGSYIFPMAFSKHSFSEYLYQFVKANINNLNKTTILSHCDEALTPALLRLKEEDANNQHSYTTIADVIRMKGYWPEQGRDAFLVLGSDVDKALAIGQDFLTKEVEVKGKGKVIICPTLDFGGDAESIDASVQSLAKLIQDAQQKMHASPSNYPNGLILSFVVNTGRHFVAVKLHLKEATKDIDVVMQDSMSAPGIWRRQSSDAVLEYIDKAMRLADPGLKRWINPVNYTSQQTDSYSCPYFAAQAVIQTAYPASQLATANIQEVKFAFLKAASGIDGLIMDPLNIVVHQDKLADAGYVQYKQIVQAGLRQQPPLTSKRKVAIDGKKVLKNEKMLRAHKKRLDDAATPAVSMSSELRGKEVYQVASEARNYLGELQKVTQFDVNSSDAQTLRSLYNASTANTNHLFQLHMAHASQLIEDAEKQLQSMVQDSNSSALAARAAANICSDPDQEVAHVISNNNLTFKSLAQANQYKAFVRETLFYIPDAKSTSTSADDDLARILQNEELTHYFKQRK
jgi:hypothetical protein